MKAINPAMLAEAIPGNRQRVGDVYLIAAKWLGDGWLAECLGRLGVVLRDIRNYPKPAEAAWKALRPDRLKKRAEIAERYHEAEYWLAKGADDRMPRDLSVWLSIRMAAIAEAVASNAKPARAVYCACGAGRPGKSGSVADRWIRWRDRAIAEDIERMRRMYPDRNEQAHHLEVAEKWYPSAYYPAKDGESEITRLQRYAESVKKARLFPN